MSQGHFYSAEAHIEHGDASVLFPVEELDATVLQSRDTELALGDVDGEDVIAVVPTSMASGYFLGQYPFTAVPVAELAPGVQSHIADVLDDPLETFEFVQIGTWSSDSPNHSLAEYTDA